ncbi:MAG: hypothetical protein NW203_01220 [Hyphomonadaceae bacterium]|nr:hypothetical protein [Hyphomonadaceae bacterium]
MRARDRLRRFFTAAAASSVIALAVLVGAFAAQIDRPTREGAGRCAFVKTKVEIAAAQPGRRLVVIGGSGVHWGVNAERLGARYGYAGVNFGTFASLGADIILWEARRALRRGDVALLALEYDVLSQPGASRQSVDFALSCGRDWLAAQDPLRQARLAVGSDPLRLTALRAAPETYVMPPQARRFSAHGDPYLDARSFRPIPPEVARRVDLYRPLSIPARGTPETERALIAFRAWAAANGVRVLVTWPNTIAFDAYARTANFAALEAWYRDLGFTVIGAPSIGLLERRYFSDTMYHLTAEGVTLRTARLESALDPVLAAGSSPVAPGSLPTPSHP